MFTLVEYGMKLTFLQCRNLQVSRVLQCWCNKNRTNNIVGTRVYNNVEVPINNSTVITFVVALVWRRSCREGLRRDTKFTQFCSGRSIHFIDQESEGVQHLCSWMECVVVNLLSWVGELRVIINAVILRNESGADRICVVSGDLCFKLGRWSDIGTCLPGVHTNAVLQWACLQDQT